jgi:hypothetical protein
MTDHNTTDLQGSIKEQHRQGSLNPADPDMQLSGKGYSQNRIDPAGQLSLSGEQAGLEVRRSGKEECKKSEGIQRIVPVVIAFVLGLLVAVLISHTSQPKNWEYTLQMLPVTVENSFTLPAEQ